MLFKITGILENNVRINQSWFAGFFPFEKPKYCVVILSAGGAKKLRPSF
jgi:cell division protein FtsI/penicillin-binding protein 2